MFALGISNLCHVPTKIEWTSEELCQDIWSNRGETRLSNKSTSWVISYFRTRTHSRRMCTARFGGRCYLERDPLPLVDR